MLKIVYPFIRCGMDVHKSLRRPAVSTNGWTALLVLPRANGFQSFTGDLRRKPPGLSKTTAQMNCTESTKVLIFIYNILESTCKSFLTHPKYVEAIRGKKPTSKDAKWIGGYLKHDLVSGSFYSRRYSAALGFGALIIAGNSPFLLLVKKNRAQNCLTVSNIAG